jgi:hypothetical protein
MVLLVPGARVPLDHRALLPFLDCVTEAIREFAAHFKSPSTAADRSNLQVEITRFGRKPGFTMTS